MNSVERREKIHQILNENSKPVSASTLARSLQVSRQVIVGDIALLRAANIPIWATPRGYILQACIDQNKFKYTIACQHGTDLLLEELYTIVDNGGEIIDVIVDHGVYGQISGQLNIKTRHDADIFFMKLNENQGLPLSSLRNGIHLHTIACNSPEEYERIILNLEEKEILFCKKDV